MSKLPDVFHLWQLIKATTWWWRGNMPQISLFKVPAQIPRITLCVRWARPSPQTQVTEERRGGADRWKKEEGILLYVSDNRPVPTTWVLETLRQCLTVKYRCRAKTLTGSVIRSLREVKIILSAPPQYCCWQMSPVCVCVCTVCVSMTVAVIPVTNTAVNLQALLVPHQDT